MPSRSNADLLLTFAELINGRLAKRYLNGLMTPAKTAILFVLSPLVLSPCRLEASWPGTMYPLGRPGAQAPRPAVVRIEVPEKENRSFGSGTLVDVYDAYGLVVTNWHVVRDATDNVTVTFPNGFRSGASILKTDSDWDLAALAIWRPNVDPMPLAAHAPRPNERLTIAGYGYDSYREVTGPCTQYVSPGSQFPYEMVEVAVTARQGDSGGPILNQSGQLAGVLFGSTKSATSGSHVDRVRQFLVPVVQHLRRLPNDSRPIFNTSPTGDANPSIEQRNGQLAIQASRNPLPPMDGHQPLPPIGGQSLATVTPIAPKNIPIEEPARVIKQGPTIGHPARSHRDRDGQSESRTSAAVDQWHKWAGLTAWEQTKSVLAILGVVSILRVFLRRSTKQ